jgi:hypothetical protein
MMNSPTRRGALGAMFGLGISAGLAPTAAFAQSAIKLPESACILSRRIERSLRDGKSLRVDRSWRVNFSKRGPGIAVTGEQIGVRVDAPASLAPLASIEEARSTADMWPILLTGSGLIVSAGTGSRDEDVAKAVRVAQGMIAARSNPASSEEAQKQFFADLQRSGSSLLDRLPDDLFFPTVGPLHAVRAVDLPDGLKGEFEISYEATAVPGKGWLDRAVRQVTTRLGSSVQTAREEWVLAKI